MSAEGHSSVFGLADYWREGRQLGRLPAFRTCLILIAEQDPAVVMGQYTTSPEKSDLIAKDVQGCKDAQSIAHLSGPPHCVFLSS